MSDELVKIIKIEKLKNTYLVTTNNDEYKIDEDTIVKHFIVKDREFTKSEFNKILKDIEVNKAFNKVIKYLSYGERTTYEIKKYLKDEDYFHQVISRLKSLGYVDDNKYALKYLDYCYRNNKGPLYCKAKLSEKGIDNKIIEEVLNNYSSVMQEEVVAKQVAKELKNNDFLPVMALKKRIINKLLRNGFSGEVVYEYLNTVEIEDKSDETLNKEYQKQLNKLSNKELNDYEKKQRIIAYLLNKGYEYQKIKEIIE